jgi:hypothetical protein
VTEVLLVVFVVLVLVALGAAVVALRVRRRYLEGNQVVPGVPTRAPPEWAGAHTPEALLHRRLRDAVAALRRNPRAGTDLADLRGSIERAALEADERLIAVAALPRFLRAEPLAKVTWAVEVIEDTVATVAAWPSSGSEAVLGDAVNQAAERMALIAEARAELQGVIPPMAAPGPGGAGGAAGPVAMDGGTGDPPPPDAPAPGP